MDKVKWLHQYDGCPYMVLKSDCDDIFGFHTSHQKYIVWDGVLTEEVFILTLTEVFLHEDR